MRGQGVSDDSGDIGHRQRLRARLLAGGGDAFQDYELLEYLLGLAIPRRDTKPLAKRLLAEFGSLPVVMAATPAELARVEGLGEGAAAAIKFVEAASLRSLRTAALDRPVLSGWQALTDYLHAAMAHRVTEEFRVIFLNNRNVMIRDESMSEGTINQAAVYPREIVKRALELGAAGMVLVHNHPSGDPQPSRDDIVMTKAIIEAGRHLALVVHDHVIVGRGGHVSMRAQGLI
ncbi:DNA repair protein RadC [Polymorphobacter fuscus]|uniref:DNA repair protein RadC n=1 Tax=Sandarakinorhabdus fusca TaxID=1439888 RepID=A0A7C9GPU9_9SPHN|nr:DNA repair protein RadC [Polymorphobacter fuscus]MQT17872.1 DNA repair protein RadC [Polymorphobacter fuscus]